MEYEADHSPLLVSWLKTCRGLLPHPQTALLFKQHQSSMTRCTFELMDRRTQGILYVMQTTDGYKVFVK